MGRFIEQAKYNENFLSLVEAQFPDDFFDWKITIVFYCTVHYLNEYLWSHDISIRSHDERNKELNPDDKNSLYPLSEDLWIMYYDMYRMCLSARYNGIQNKNVQMKKFADDLKTCKVNFEELKKFVEKDLESA